MPKSLKVIQHFKDGERVANLAIVTSSNKPHIVPVFFTYEDGKVRAKVL